MKRQKLLQSAPQGQERDFLFSPIEAQRIIGRFSAPNYPPPVGLAKVGGLGEEDCVYRMNFLDMNGKTIRMRPIIDCHSMYSVRNIGTENEMCTRIRRELAELILSGLAALGRDKNHDLYAEVLPVMRAATEMDMFLPKLSGNEVVDAAFKAARKFTGRPGIIAFEGCFHGRNMTATSLSSSEKSREGFGPFIPCVINDVPFGDIDALKDVLKLHKGTIAGCVMELVQGEGGVNVPHDDYPRQVQELLRTYGVLFIVDEIQTGMGRVGGTRATDLFAYQSYGVTPDLACFGKAAGGGEVPFSFLGGRKDIMSCFGPGTEGLTWSAYPLGCRAFTLAVDETIKNRLSIESLKKGRYMLQGLRKHVGERFPHAITDIRGKGLFIGAQVHPDFCTGRELSYALLHNGVWAKETGETGQVIRLAPPLTITYKQIDECVIALLGAFALVGKEGKRSRIRKALRNQGKL